MKKLYLILIATVLCAGAVIGQSQLKKANKLFEEFKVRQHLPALLILTKKWAH